MCVVAFGTVIRLGAVVLGLATHFPVSAAPEIFIEDPEGIPLQTGTVVMWGSNIFGQTIIPAGAQSEVTCLAPGDHHSVVMKGDGTVMAWGSNSLGETNVPPALAGVKTVTAGAAHTLLLKNDNTVVAFGSNQYGQSNVPAAATNIQAVSGGLYHSLALKTDGTVIAWGRNDMGQTSVPSSLTGVVAIAAGQNHNLALRSNGTVMAWGAPGLQLSVPNGLTNVKAVAAGLDHSIALKNDGTLVAWGANTYGQAVVPSGLSGVVDVSAGKHHNIALKGDGTVVAWGRNFSGATVVPSGLRSVRAIKAGDSHNMALVDSVVGFGEGSILSPGIPRTFTIRNTGESDLNISSVVLSGAESNDFVVDVSGLSSLIPSGGQSSFTVAFNPVSIGNKRTVLRVLSDDPDEAAFHVNLTGRAFPEIAVFTGNGIAPVDERSDNTGEYVFLPTVTSSNSIPQTFTILNTGINPLSGLAINIGGLNPDDFSVSTLESTTLGPGGSETFQITFAPRLKGPRVATVLIKSDDENENPFRIKISGTGGGPEISLEQPDGKPLFTGSVVAWGKNTLGQTNVPVGLSGVASISAGTQSLAVKSDGTLVSWGDNSFGQINTPAGLDGVKAASAATNHTVVLKQDGIVLAWGYNGDGRCNIPSGLANLKTIDSGGAQNTALKTDGNLVVWGRNAFLPAALASGGVQSFDAGEFYRIALKNDGSVVIWGDSSYTPSAADAFNPAVAVSAGGFQLIALKSDGTVRAASYWSPDHIAAQVPAGLSCVIAISAGYGHCLALKKDGTVVAWGYNGDGQINVPIGLTGVKAISAGYAHNLALIDSTVEFGYQATSTHGISKTFIIINSGTAPLNIVGARLSGEDASDFALNTTGMLDVVPAGGQTAFSAAFSPGASALGVRRAVLQVANNDLDEGNFDVVLTGNAFDSTGLSALEVWRQTWFGPSANSVNASTLADFDGDGIVNLLEYAFGSDPTWAASSPKLTAGVSGNEMLQITYQRPIGGAAGIQYVVEISEGYPGDWRAVSESDVSQTITPNDDGSETVTMSLTPHDFPVDMPIRLFMRIRISG